MICLADGGSADPGQFQRFQVVLVSADTHKSDWVLQEVEEGLATQKRLGLKPFVIAALVPGTDPSSLSSVHKRLGELLCVKLEDGLEHAVDQIKNALVGKRFETKDGRDVE